MFIISGDTLVQIHDTTSALNHPTKQKAIFFFFFFFFNNHYGSVKIV